ncbi:MAG: class I SAM-dependent RNA methyltransferase, partial [Gemmatimonadetes bacterium]|nr:class I SAM-dependent RNA methyltransferase [Gemmatimonadota bacterium]
MKRGEHITLEIDRLNAKGDGVGICDGREVVVPRAVPGDRALVYLRRKRKGRFEGVIDDLIEPGVERVDPQCVHFGVCGGCRWQDIAYEDQLQIKETLVRRLVAERDLPVALWRPILPSPVQDFYRNKMEFSFGSSQDGTPQLGLHMRGRYNRVFDLETCWLQSEISNRIVDSVRTHATQLGLPVYDLRSHEGLLRFLVVRDAKRTGQVMVNLVVARYPDDGVDALLEAVLADLHEEITTCIVTLHSGKAQVALGEEEFHVRGDGHMWERCGEMEYAISARSFFQTNTLAAERLYETVCELAGDLVES